MNRKKSMVIAFFAIILLTLAFVPISRLVGSYDPWLDYDGNGIIDAHDLHPLGQAYGTSGDPTRNVNVTNWPVQHELFPQNLKLKGVIYNIYGPSAGIVRRDLTDATTTPPTPIKTTWIIVQTIEYDPVSAILNQTKTLFYNNTFIYEKIPTSAYQILGAPRAISTFNVTITVYGGPTYLDFYLYLGKISMSGEWTQLASFSRLLTEYQFGAVTDEQTRYNAGPPTPVNIPINAYERLAIRILVYGQAFGTPSTVTLEILLRQAADDFVVDIPIVENP